MRLHRAGGARLLPAAYGIPWVPEIPRQWRRGTEPGVTAVTNVFGIPDDPAAGTQPRAAHPPAPGIPDDPAAGTQPRAAHPPAPGIPDDPAAGTQPRAAHPPAPGIPDDPAAGTQPRAAHPPAPGIPDDPAAGTQPRAAPLSAPANSGGPTAGPQPRGARPPAPSGHEQVVFCHDAPTGLRAIIAIYSTALGPALGGTRFYPYPSEDAALADVLNLSRAMAYKNALADLDHGGGKAVIIGDPARLKSEALLRAYGRFVQSLNGRYITACDVGTYSEDMDIVARECRHVTGRTEPNGGAGDSSVLTAFGVFQGMRAAAEHTWGTSSLEDRRVGVEGVGKVGRRLVDHLIEAGAQVVICDVNPDAVERIRARYPSDR